MQSAKPALRLLEVPEKLCDFPLQPRSYRPPGYIESLSANIKANGQLVPAIGWGCNGRWQLEEGGCRLAAIRLASLPTLLLMDLGCEPSKGQILIAQASIDLHKEHLPPVDRARLYGGIMETEKLTGKQLAGILGRSETFVSRFLPLVKLSDDLQKAVNEGTLEWTKGSLIALETDDHGRQRELAEAAMGMTRDALASHLRKKTTGQPNTAPRDRKKNANAIKTATLRLDLGAGWVVTVKGAEPTLLQTADILMHASEEARKGHNQGQSAEAFCAAMRERAKSAR
jgi:ParB family transcriptional regulator, chromosome partitioning protein